MATIRTVKLRPPPSAPAPVTDAPAAPPAAPPALDAAGDAVAARLSQSRTLMFWLALGIFLCAVTILALQFTEFSFYREPPSVWPLK